MTAGPGSNPIKNFQDVIDRDINVVARHSTSNHEVLKTAVEGTPMYNYYYDTMHDDPNYFVKVRVQIDYTLVLCIDSTSIRKEDADTTHGTSALGPCLMVAHKMFSSVQLLQNNRRT